MNELIDSQKNILGISDFLQNAEQYTQENFPDLDVDSLFSSAIGRKYLHQFLDNQHSGICRTRSKSCFTNYGNSLNCDYHS